MEKCDKRIEVIAKLEREAEVKDTEAKIANAENKIYKECVSRINGKTGGVSKLTEIQVRFPNAKPLKLLHSEEYLKNTNYKLDKRRPYQTFKEQFLEEILSAHLSGSVEKILGDTIIKSFEDYEIEEQPLWCTDTSRMKYVVMKEPDKEEGEEKSKWKADPNGIYTKKRMIDPLLNSLKEQLIKYTRGEYLKKYDDYIKSKKRISKKIDRNYIDRYFRYQETAHDLLNKIENGTIHKKLLKYISNYFSLTERRNIGNS